MPPLFQPQLVNGVFGDPVLYLESRDEPRALMFDLGDVSALPPRRLLRLSDVFVSHAHMDHTDLGTLRALPQYKSTPILMLTTESSDAMKQQGRAAGATGWLVKPFDPQKLLEVVRKVIG